MLNLDTHILINALLGDLKQGEEALLSMHQWSISSIVLWEISKLFELNRVTLDIKSYEFKSVLSNIHIWPIDLEICRAISRLDFKSDPADEIIAATSVVHGVALITRDKVIKKSKIVPLALATKKL